MGGVPRCGVGVPLPLVIVLSRREVGGVGSSAGQGGSSGHIGVATPKVGGPRVGGDRGGRAECSAIAGRKGARVVCQNRSRAGGMRAGVKLGHVPTAAAGTECAPKKRGGAAEGGEQSSRGKRAIKTDDAAVAVSVTESEGGPDLLNEGRPKSPPGEGP